jgi:hypothetical protein
MGPRKIGVLSFLLAAVIIMPSVLFAEEGTTAKEETSNGTVTVITKDRYTFESDVSHMSGKVSVNQSDLDVKYETKAFGKLPVSVWFDYKHFDINENIPVDLPASLNARRFGVGTKFPVPFSNTNQHFIAVDVMPSWYSDDSSFTRNSFRVPFRAYLIYKPSDTFVMIAGAQIDTDADTPVIPIIGFNYQPNDRLDIQLASTEPTITYKLDHHWAVFAEYGATLDEYEVTRASQKGVVFKVREAALGGGLKFKIEKWLEASLSTGLNTWRQFAYRDNVGKVDVNSAPYIKARFSVIF